MAMMMRDPPAGSARAAECAAALRDDVAGADLRAAVFIDKDGTLLEDVPYNVDPRQIVFAAHAFEALKLLQACGFALAIVTNQPGVALHYFDQQALDRYHAALRERLTDAGIALAGVFACPHAPFECCSCRKPAPGLLHQAARTLGLDLDRSWLIGDILDDIEAGHRAGCRAVLLDVGHETVWRYARLRVPDRRATTLLEASRQIIAAEAERSAPGADAFQPMAVGAQ